MRPVRTSRNVRTVWGRSPSRSACPSSQAGDRLLATCCCSTCSCSDCLTMLCCRLPIWNWAAASVVLMTRRQISEWVLSGQFPAGRPEWERAGVTFADGAAGIAPHERRKLLLLNGAHSLLAYTGSNRGLLTIADAIGDDYCRELVRVWWAESSPQVG